MWFEWKADLYGVCTTAKQSVMWNGFAKKIVKTVTNCYLCRPSPPTCQHHGHNDPMAPHEFICALAQVKDKQDDTMNFSSLAHELQCNMTHTLIWTLLWMIRSWRELAHLVRPEVLLKLLSFGVWCCVVWYNSTNMPEKPSASIRAEDEDKRLLYDHGLCLPDYTALQPTRQ
jgi:hypothetical protein